MRKITKILVCAAVVATIGTGSLFAKGKGGMGGHDGRDGFGKMKGVNVTTDADGNTTITRSYDLMGQVSAVDEKGGTVTIQDLDGKKTVLAVNPFTRIRIYDSNSDKTISDIKKGDWIMYSLYNTETENKVASRIIVKNN